MQLSTWPYAHKSPRACQSTAHLTDDPFCKQGEPMKMTTLSSLSSDIPSEDRFTLKLNRVWALLFCSLSLISISTPLQANPRESDPELCEITRQRAWHNCRGRPKCYRSELMDLIALQNEVIPSGEIALRCQLRLPNTPTLGVTKPK